MDIVAILADLRNEPDWRAECARSHDYYDNQQLTADRLAVLEERGMPARTRNLVFQAVNNLLGLEERARQDWRVPVNDDVNSDQAVALGKLLHQAERLSGCDRACSDAFATQVKGGVGWVGVHDADDLAAYAIGAESPRWQEMWWDWRARHPLLDDARYLVRRKWVDRDECVARWPGHRTLIQNAAAGWPDWFADVLKPTDQHLASAWDRERTVRDSLDDAEWRDSERGRLALFEVWYRRIEAGLWLLVPELDMADEYDPANLGHRVLVETGRAELRRAPIRRVRRAWWLGPHKLNDDPSPYGHRWFPYVPFFGFREDRTLAPYGLVRLMQSPQDEANARLAKMEWLLSAQRLIGAEDAFAIPVEDVLGEMGRPDAFIPLKKGRSSNDVKLQEHSDLSAQQFSVLQDALRWITEIGGVYQAMLGKTQAQQSGVAINSLVEQGNTSQGELFGNYRLSRTRVGELLLAQVVRIFGSRQKPVQIRRGTERKTVVFGERQPDGRVSNALAQLRTRVELSEVPSTPAFRQQALNQLGEIVKALPPNLQAVLAPALVRESGIPQSEEYARLLEQVLGTGEGARAGADPAASDPAQQQADAVAQQRQQTLDALTERATAAEVAQAEAKAEEAGAKAERARIETAQLAEQLRGATSESEAALLAEAMHRREMRLGASPVA